MNGTNQDNSSIFSSNSTNMTQTTANITIITNLTKPNATLIINATIIKNGSSINQTVEDSGDNGNKVKGAIIGSILGFIGLCVCTCVFSARLRRWCRNTITGHENEDG